MKSQQVSRTSKRKPRGTPPSPQTDAVSVRPSEALPDPRRWLALAAILAASFLGVLDFFIVNVSIPAIEQNLGATDADIELVLVAYALTYGVVLITGGRLGDLYGRKRMFLWGVAGFTLTSALCGLAPTPVVLIVSRVLQGITGAVMFPQVLSIIQVTFPPAERSRAFSILGMVVGAASFSGNVLGGLLVDANVFGLGWRPIFLVNLPIGILALLAARRLLRESRSPAAARNDPIGVALASLGLFLFIYPLVEGRDLGWPIWGFGMLAASLALLPVFLWHERRVTAQGGTPLIDLTLFRDRTFVAGLLTVAVFYAGLTAFFLAFTMFLQKGMGQSAHDAGLTFAPFAIGFFLSSTFAVKWSALMGRRSIQVGAALMALMLGGVIVLAALQGTTMPVVELVPLLLVYGFGQGLVVPTLMAIVLSGVPSHSAGSASGVLTTTQQVALALGVAAIGSVYFGVLGPAPKPTAYAGAIAVAMLCNVGLLVGTFGLVFLLPRRTTGHGTVVAEF